MFKFLIILLLLLVLGSLFTALVFLVKDPSTSTRVVKSLALRIALSLIVIGLIFVGAKFGVIEPHGFGE